MAVARAGALAGVPVTVYLGNDALKMKVDGIKALGAEVVVIDGPAGDGDAELAARRAGEEQGRT